MSRAPCPKRRKQRFPSGENKGDRSGKEWTWNGDLLYARGIPKVIRITVQQAQALPRDHSNITTHPTNHSISRSGRKHKTQISKTAAASNKQCPQPPPRAAVVGAEQPRMALHHLETPAPAVAATSWQVNKEAAAAKSSSHQICGVRDRKHHKHHRATAINGGEETATIRVAEKTKQRRVQVTDPKLMQQPQQAKTKRIHNSSRHKQTIATNCAVSTLGGAKAVRTRRRSKHSNAVPIRAAATVADDDVWTLQEAETASVLVAKHDRKKARTKNRAKSHVK